MRLKVSLLGRDFDASSSFGDSTKISSKKRMCERALPLEKVVFVVSAHTFQVTVDPFSITRWLGTNCMFLI